ncbi:MAG: hypothetical protein KBC48_02750 [Candidatus Pacebacteria bacterium]|nr:hypothetical protein [Candidatus Paceibacterota bacterium]
MKTNRGFVPILAILIVAVIAVGGGYWVYQEVGGDVDFNLPPIELSNDEGNFTTPSPKPFTPTQPVACTMEAKICPDGSAVGRTGPKCEFAQCPAPKSIQVEINASQEVLKRYVDFHNKYGIDFSAYLNPDPSSIESQVGSQLIIQATESVIPEVMSTLRSFAEVYMANNPDYKDICNDSDFLQLFSNVRVAVGEKEVVCNSNAGGYAASTRLPSGYFWCVDSTGYAGPGNQLSKQTVCTKVTY